ncbi:MAG TPA: MBL fold metallo-hydrolase [Candidatus Saccharimonadales bacterium]|nr:MBL fold metallo-hydrolase [Candidatus Saccharimonadales bacterium]
MKITKYLHSCLLIEEEGKVILVDPGNYSYDGKVLDINRLNQLDAIVITHEHADHMDIRWLKEILQKFPNAPIFTTQSAKNILGQEGITNVKTEGNEFISLQPVPHEKIWFGTPAQNVLATLFGKFATPGDSHTFTTNAEVLALPITAPWGSTTRAVEIALELKPKVVIPIHDWHWKDEARKGFYARLKEYFAQNDIDFKAVETGETVEV